MLIFTPVSFPSARGSDEEASMGLFLFMSEKERAQNDSQFLGQDWGIDTQNIYLFMCDPSLWQLGHLS